jgi:anhydro-N-acetylmuramic acid kinase
VSDKLLIAGVMTGNSLDAADAVLTAFSEDGTPEDVCFVSLPFPRTLSDGLRRLRVAVEREHGNMGRVARDAAIGFKAVSDAYILHVADAVDALKREAHRRGVDAIDAIGLHGQTCAHFPPSVAARSGQAPYTVQIADAAALADLSGTTAVYDFRSDDMMNGGEGAPFAPLHHLHLAEPLKKRGAFPVLLFNAGNTGNVTLLHEGADGRPAAFGWDSGPFCHFPDFLTRSERNMPHDKDGRIGGTGKVRESLLAALFRDAATTAQGGNFLDLDAPKSSDPAWYRAAPELIDPSAPFEDRLRTAEYFAAYAAYHTLGYAKGEDLPSAVLLFGGGWRNPVVLAHFRALLEGNFSAYPVLPEHRERFLRIRERMTRGGRTPSAAFSEDRHVDSRAMEARIFADAAFCRILGVPFSLPEATGCKAPTVCGLIRFPHGDPSRATPRLKARLVRAGAQTARQAEPLPWSRAAGNG